MPFFLHQVSYTPEALTRLLANPQDRFDAVRGPIEKLGGRVMNSYFAFGQYDAVLITEMPDNVSAAAIALAFAAGGSYELENARFENCQWKFQNEAQRTCVLLNQIGLLPGQQPPQAPLTLNTGPVQ